jgi:tRNA/tmRNA/rRNA uracil-C5-methylase (TrmA/RlmC/RlmD family)
MKTFDDILNIAVSRAAANGRTLQPGECQTPRGNRCSLCHASIITYDAEIRIKQESLRTLWNGLFPARVLASIVPSPLGRSYRTVSKRRVFPFRATVRLGLIAPTHEGSYKPLDVEQCAIEPEAHAVIYKKVQELIERPYAKPLAAVLSYVIVKGSYTEHTIVLNVREIDPAITRAANTLSKSLTHFIPAITGVFLFEDKSDGRYYFGGGNPRSLRKLFGNPEIFQRIRGRSFLYSPLSFSQTNASIVDSFVEKAGALLDLHKEHRLFDLYCGYGLFGLCLSESVAAVFGVDSAADSISSAIANAKRQKATNVRFTRSDITQETLPRLLGAIRENDLVLLDPPRGGTGEGVVECIAARKPERVLHIFCNIDILPAELTRWEKAGYSIVRAVPFDMFPGTSSVEVMVLLKRN